MSKLMLGAVMLGAALLAVLSQFARVRPGAKTRARGKAREQAQKERAQKRKQLLKVYDDMLLRYDVLAQRLALTGMNRQPAVKPRAPLPPRKAPPRLRKP